MDWTAGTVVQLAVALCSVPQNDCRWWSGKSLEAESNFAVHIITSIFVGGQFPTSTPQKMHRMQYLTCCSSYIHCKTSLEMWWFLIFSGTISFEGNWLTSHYFSDLQIFKISPACFALKEFRCKNAGLFTSWSQNLSLFDNLKLLVERLNPGMQSAPALTQVPV